MYKSEINNMTVIKKTIEFKVSEPIDIKKMTIEYFKKSGFKYMDNNSNDGKIIFERGSIASNMWTFNPLNWKSEIDIEFNGDCVRANLKINATGQIPTNKDEKLWETFIDHFKKYLQDSNFDFITENSKIVNATKNRYLTYIVWAVLGGLIGGLPAGLIAYWTGINSIVSIGAAGGAIVFLTKKINVDKNKNGL